MGVDSSSDHLVRPSYSFDYESGIYRTRAPMFEWVASGRKGRLSVGSARQEGSDQTKADNLYRTTQPTSLLEVN